MSIRVPFLVPSAALHNFPPYLLSDIDGLLGCEVNTDKQVRARTLTLSECSTSGTKSIIVSAASPDSAKFRAMTRALRLVIRRKLQPILLNGYHRDYPEQSLSAYVTEYLECGHKLDVFQHDLEPLIAKRRNCPECAGVSHKKPVQSVRFPARNKEAA